MTRVEHIGCVDCEDGPCYMNCGPAKPATIVIDRFNHCRIEQEPHGEMHFYRVVSSNNIILHEADGPVSCYAHAEWFEKQKTLEASQRRAHAKERHK